eukprot:TRINITY_DN50129_c0_g1_i1.p2 TRINITY_DN50129_c0_g1~~TRINITY_DN50129_c0_g1_i1.p2  ORF type:complete len:171 (+),score=30.02 TRINITY_DN50129_c0_g1_i1:574-1086(+)
MASGCGGQVFRTMLQDGRAHTEPVIENAETARDLEQLMQNQMNLWKAQEQARSTADGPTAAAIEATITAAVTNWNGGNSKVNPVPDSSADVLGRWFCGGPGNVQYAFQLNPAARLDLWKTMITEQGEQPSEEHLAQREVLLCKAKVEEADFNYANPRGEVVSAMKRRSGV